MAVAVKATLAPESIKPPDAGDTVPPTDGAANVINWYCVPKLAVNTLLPLRLMAWEAAPESLQTLKIYCVPGDPDWTACTANVCCPDTRFKV